MMVWPDSSREELRGRAAGARVYLDRGAEASTHARVLRDLLLQVARGGEPEEGQLG